MSEYEVRGSYNQGGNQRRFTREIQADNEDVAREWIYTEFGSKHRLKRNEIEIDEVEEI